MLLRRMAKRMVHRLGYDVTRYCPPRLGVDAFSDIRRLLDGTSCPVIFDIGANIGQTTSRFKERIPDSVIHAFEPNKSAYEELADNTKKMRGVHLNNLAVGARAGKRLLIENTCSEMSSFLEPGECCWGEIAGRRMVDIVTVDDYCRGRDIEHIDVLKTDTQGYDLEVLRGARSLLDRDSVRLVYMEVTFSDMYRGLPSFDEIFRLLTDHRFRLVSFYEFFYQDNAASWSDALFVNRQYRAVPRVQAVPGDWRAGVKCVPGAHSRERM